MDRARVIALTLALIAAIAIPICASSGWARGLGVLGLTGGGAASEGGAGGYTPGPNEVVCIVDTDTANEDAHYHTLAAAIAGESGATPVCATGADLAANAEQLTFLMRSSTGVADTTAVTIGSTTFSTSTDYFVRIVADPDHRHNGVWDNSKYRHEAPASASAGIKIAASHYVVDGLQIKMTTDYSNRFAIRSEPGAAGFNIIRNNLIVGVPSSTNLTGVSFPSSTARAQVYNNVISGFNGTGLSFSGGSGVSAAFNNTFFGNAIGLDRFAGTVTIKNNISVGNSTADYNGAFTTSTNNLSSDATATGTGSITGAIVKYSTDTLTAAAKSTDKWVIFQSSTDRSLVSAIDTLELNDAIGAGVDVGLDTDIAGNDWATVPSMGAFELE